MALNRECTLSDDELVEKCNEWVSKLAESGGKSWALRVPVDFNNDPDMLFIELGKRFLSLKGGISEPEPEYSNEVNIDNSTEGNF